MASPSSPPPPPKKNSRKHERYEMFASVEVHGSTESVLLPARNISLGGVYLTADGHDLSAFAIGAQLEVLVFDALDDRQEPVRLMGQVVRHDQMGMALMWAYADPDLAFKLGALIESLQKPK
jgi:hypothetical protein